LVHFGSNAMLCCCAPHPKPPPLPPPPHPPIIFPPPPAHTRAPAAHSGRCDSRDHAACTSACSCGGGDKGSVSRQGYLQARSGTGGGVVAHSALDRLVATFSNATRASVVYIWPVGFVFALPTPPPPTPTTPPLILAAPGCLCPHQTIAEGAGVHRCADGRRVRGSSIHPRCHSPPHPWRHCWSHPRRPRWFRRRGRSV
jgi:hypothetical protein